MSDEKTNGGGVTGDVGRDVSERRLFRDYALSHEAVRDLFNDLARDYTELAIDQRCDRLLAIAAQLSRLRDQTESTRAGVRALAVEIMNDPVTQGMKP